MIDPQNPYNMTCIRCGVPLIKGTLSQGTSTLFGKLAKVGKSWASSYIGLICPNGHKYTLSEVENQVEKESITISKDLINLLKKNGVENLDFGKLISDDKTKIYAVNYGLFTKMSTDKIPFARKPTPSNLVIDNVKMYICALTNYTMSNSDSQRLVFAVVPQRESPQIFSYNIVWYYSRER